MSAIAASAAQKLLTAGARVINPVSAGVQVATSLQKKISKQSIELFGYDFPGLLVKLLFFFAFAFLISKLMEAIIFTRGAFTIIAGLFGFKIPPKDQIPIQVQEFFGEGFHKIRFWDAVKVVAVLLVVVEYVNYVQVNTKNGGTPSAMTTGVFLLIGLLLSATVFPEIVQRIKELKKTDLNIAEMK